VQARDGASLDSATANVLLLTLDTVRADRLGSYGYPLGTTPNLDRFAETAVQFDLAIAQAAVTPVSHASIFTGLDPYHHGLRVLHGRVANHLVPAHTTLAEIWRDAGGRTAAFVSAFPVTAAFGLDQGFEKFDARFPSPDGGDIVVADGTVNTGISQRRADETTRAAVNWLMAEVGNEIPFFAWVHYFDTHDPVLLPPEEYLGRFQPASDQRGDMLRTIYDAELLFVDAQIGLLFEQLALLGFWENTIVIVVADHGEGLGDHDWWSHGILYQEQIRVPLLVRLPGMESGRRIASLVRTTDLMPTVLEVAGISRRVWPEMDGASLVDALRGGEAPGNLLAYSDSVSIMNYGRPDASKWDHKWDKLYSLTSSRYKFVYHQPDPANNEFYDLQADPGELQNLASSNPPAMRELAERLEDLDAFSKIMPGDTPSDPDVRENLRSLGYPE
jgi:arylsulfatase A-like enzyme